MAQSHLSAAQTPLGVAREAVRAKRHKYAQMAAAMNAEFVLFVESYGTFGPAAVQFLKKVAEHAEDSLSGWTRLEVLNGCVGAAQVAVQTGNAFVSNEGAQQRRRGGGGGGGAVV